MIAVLVSLLVTLLLLTAAAAMILETYLLATGKRPITWYTRNVVSNHYGWAQVLVAVLLLAAGWALGHFVTDVSSHVGG